MDWKEFLRPNLKKITIIIIFFLIPYLYNFNKALVGLRQLRSIEWTLVKFYPLIYGEFFGCGNEPFIEKCFEINFIATILVILALYFFSCAIIFAYNKFKKK